MRLWERGCTPRSSKIGSRVRLKKVILIAVLLVQRIFAIYQYSCAKNGKGLKISTKEADTL